MLRQLGTSFSLSLWALCAIYIIGCSIFHEVKYAKLIFTTVSTLILIVAFINSFRASRKQANKIKEAAEIKATVIRGGVEKVVETSQVVVGDLVKIVAGDIIAADIRIVQSNGLKVNNAKITGEIQDLIRDTKCTDENFT